MRTPNSQTEQVWVRFLFSIGAFFVVFFSTLLMMPILCHHTIHSIYFYVFYWINITREHAYRLIFKLLNIVNNMRIMRPYFNVHVHKFTCDTLWWASYSIHKMPCPLDTLCTIWWIISFLVFCMNSKTSKNDRMPWIKYGQPFIKAHDEPNEKKTAWNASFINSVQLNLRGCWNLLWLLVEFDQRVWNEGKLNRLSFHVLCSISYFMKHI